jgi:hypothetical protein
MVLSVVITTYWVLGLKIETEPKKPKVTPFSFPLPFPQFRNVSNNFYWEEVLNKIYEVSNTSAKDKIYISTQEEYLLNSKIFENTSRISDVLATNFLPLVYIGETRGSVKGVISPFVINPVDFYRWFYLAQNINQVENYFHNRRSYGVKKPVSAWEQGFEESLLREKFSFLFENTTSDFFDKTSDLVFTGEGLIYSGDDQKVVLSFLDAAKPGFWRIYTDKTSSALCLETLKVFDESLYKEHEKQISVLDLAGCLIVPKCTKVEFKYNSGPALVINLRPDSISVIPFDKQDKIQAKVFFDKGDKIMNVTGGDLGLVVDNRSRPLLRDKSSKQRISSIERWVKEISSKVDIANTEKDKTITPKKEEQQASVSPPKKVISALSKKDEEKNLAEDTEKKLIAPLSKKLLENGSSPKLKNNL